MKKNHDKKTTKTQPVAVTSAASDIRPAQFFSGSNVVIRVEDLWKEYRLGIISHKSLSKDLQSWWARTTGKEDPNQKIDLTTESINASGSESPDRFWALQDISFDVKQGEILGIIGKNGAGKSTLLKILSKVTTPSKGQIKVKGRVASLLEVGTGFHPELTGRENVFLNGAILGMSKAEIRRKLDEIVDFAEVGKFVDTPVKRYSSGMYVRLAFAVAAHLEPEILVVDEVLAVGDAAFQKKCLGKMGEVTKEGRTILFVSHNMASVQTLCSTGLVLRDGKMFCLGTTLEAIDAYEKALQNSINRDVAVRKDRKGTQVVKCVKIEIYNNLNEPTNSIPMGSSFSVEVSLVGKLSHAIIGILIGNTYKTQMIRGYTYESCDKDITIDGSAKIRCYFDDFPMMHGSYNVHVWVGRRAEVADYIENAIELTIEPRDIFGTGRLLDPLGGVAFAKTTWEFNNGE